MKASTAVESATTVKSTASVESASTMKPAAAAESAAYRPMAEPAAGSKSATARKAATRPKSAAACKPATPAKASWSESATACKTASESTASETAPSESAITETTPSEPTVPVKESAAKTAEPRSRADEHSSYKPIRAVVAIRRAVIRVKAVVAVGTNGRGAIVIIRAVVRPVPVAIGWSVSHSHSDRHLRLRGSRNGKKKNRQHRQIF